MDPVIVGLVVGALGAAIAIARGGSLRALAETTFRWTWVLFLSLVVQIVFEFWSPEWLSEQGQLVVVLATNAGVAVFLILNRALPGTVLAGIGLLMNVTVMALNGAMPVSEDAARLAGISEPLDVGIQHEPTTEETRLVWLADVIPLPAVHLVLSAGDVVLATGIGRLAYKRAASIPRARHRAARASSASD